MELPDNPTQPELRAWSNARQALGSELHEELTEPASLLARFGDVISSTLHGRWVTKTRSTNLNTPPTRRGGSPTVGRKPNHRTFTTAQPQPGTAQETSERSRPLTSLSVFVRVWKFLIGTDDPKALIGSWIAVALILVAVFA